MKVLAVIPARYASTRFPGKPLAQLGGRAVIRWVWDRVSALPELEKAVVATDDERILQAVREFGGEAMMTSDQHRSGTDRCGEVVRRLAEAGETYDVVVNVQGDEPFISGDQLRQLVDCFADPSVQIATLRTPITAVEELLSPNNVKVVCGVDDRALYFSRQPLPFVRGKEVEQWLDVQRYFKHVGVYAFRTEVLERLVQLPQSPLEQAESLEQLRWLENGYRIAVRTTDHANMGIDTPADLAEAERFINENNNNTI